MTGLIPPGERLASPATAESSSGFQSGSYTSERGALLDGAVATPRFRTTLGRWRFWIIVAVALIVAAIAISVITGGGRAPGQRFGLTNPAEQGAMALAEVLRDHGVTVTHATSFTEVSAAVSAGSTVFVVDPDDYLSYADTTLLDGLGAAGGALVLFQPSQTVLDAVAPTVASAGAAEPVDSVPAECSLPAAVRAETISPAGRTYRVLGAGSSSESGSAPQLCFPSFSDAYSVVVAGTDSHPVTVLGATDVITNGGIINQGNAALALGLLGTSSNLVWYEPSAADFASDLGAPPPISELAPGWITPVVFLAALVAIAAMIWRGRRLGALVVERLPVTVRARETMEGRARLYSRSGARSRALDALRIGTIRRLVVALGLPSNATVPEVCRAVAALTGRPEIAVAATLVSAIPRSDGELLALSHQLTELEAAVANRTTL